MIDRQTLSRWRAAAGIWAHFIKPSLLVAEAEGMPPAIGYPETLSWAQRVPNCALVIELPALEAVAVGVALARMNWSVIPMFNTTPGLAELLPASELVLALRAAALELPGTAAAADLGEVCGFELQREFHERVRDVSGGFIGDTVCRQRDRSLGRHRELYP